MPDIENINDGSIQRDDKGRYRSKRLPSMPGESVRLPVKLEQPEGIDAWKHRIDDLTTPIVLELFCGAGGMSLGFEDAGFFVAAGVDADAWACMSHGHNLLSKTIHRDVRDIDDPIEFIRELGLPRVDVVIGGPPCQGFARVGRGKLRSVKRDDESSLEDHYSEILNNLYVEFVRFVEKLQPLAFVMENVPDMARYNNGELLKRIKLAFPGYNVEHTILNAVYFGVPQRRDRLFFQGNRVGKPIHWPVPEAFAKPVTIQQAIGDLPFQRPPSLIEALAYTATDQTDYQRRMRERVPAEQRAIVHDHIIRQVRDDDKAIFAMLKEGDKYRDLPEEWQRYRSDIFDDKYRKLVYNQPAWTITAHIRKDAYRYIHPDSSQGRTLSIREFARLQSFPDHFRFCGPRTERLKQIGNAVPPLLAQAIADTLRPDVLSAMESRPETPPLLVASEELTEPMRTLEMVLSDD